MKGRGVSGFSFDRVPSSAVMKLIIYALEKGEKTEEGKEEEEKEEEKEKRKKREAVMGYM